MKQFWEDRFAEKEYAYSKSPNDFFKEIIQQLAVGKVLLPAEGEGRNAVYAAQQSWQVDTFDFSENAMKKALKLAQSRNVTINYFIEDINTVILPKNHYDVVALLYAHLPSNTRRVVHEKLSKTLRVNGRLILEAFSKKQIENNSGGPKNVDMLYTVDELKEDFKSLVFHILEEKEITINQGKYHQGNANVIRVHAIKI